MTHFQKVTLLVSRFRPSTPLSPSSLSPWPCPSLLHSPSPLAFFVSPSLPLSLSQPPFPSFSPPLLTDTHTVFLSHHLQPTCPDSFSPKLSQSPPLRPTFPASASPPYAINAAAMRRREEGRRVRKEGKKEGRETVCSLSDPLACLLEIETCAQQELTSTSSHHDWHCVPFSQSQQD
jgi:hypothetical protein